MKLISIVVKNLRIIFRSPSILLLLIIGPILLMFLIGLAYNSENLVNTKVGVFGDDVDLFSNYNIDYINYNIYDNKIITCTNDLKKGKINMCVKISTQKKDGNIVSAQLIYYVDNTRNSFSNILIAAFERDLKQKTNEISSQTISSILKEIDNTLNTLNSSRLYINELNEVLIKSDQTLRDEEQNVKSNIGNLKTGIEVFDANKQSFSNDITKLKSSKTYIQNNEISENIEIIDENLYDLNDILEIIEEEAKINYGYVPNNIQKAYKILDDSFEEVEYLNENMNDIEDIFININPEEMENSIDTIDRGIDGINPTINNLESNYDDLLNNVGVARKNVTNIKNNVDEKYLYFNELNSKDSSEIVKPISSERVNLYEEFSKVHELSPSIIVLVLLFIGLLLSNVIVSIEMNSKANFRNLIAPVSDKLFILGLFFTSLLIILFQIIFFLLVLYIFFGIPTIQTHIFSILIIIIHTATIFILLGILISLMFKSDTISILMTTFLILFLFLLSDIIVPLELMPLFFSNLLHYNPVIISKELFRLIFFYPEPLKFSSFFIFYLYSFILIILINIFSKKRRKIIIN